MHESSRIITLQEFETHKQEARHEDEVHRVFFVVAQLHAKLRDSLIVLSTRKVVAIVGLRIVGCKDAVDLESLNQSPQGNGCVQYGRVGVAGLKHKVVPGRQV